ncbi:MAG: prolyl oligopeptidase family serine peptidase [Pseudomonadota bacterium]
MTDNDPARPSHRKEVRRIKKYGTLREDAYSWMKPADWQQVLKDPLSLGGDIKQAINQENLYTEAKIAMSSDLAAEIRDGLKQAEQRASQETGSVWEHYFYVESVCEKGDMVFKRRDMNTGLETTILSMSDERQNKPYAKLAWGGPRLSHSGDLFAWSIDETGSGDFAVKVKCINTGDLVVSDLHHCHGSFALEKDGRFLFWVGKDTKGRPNAVWRRDIEAGTDHLCFESDDLSLFIDLKTSASGDYVFIRLLNGEGSEVWFIPSRTPQAQPVLIEPRTPGHDYDVEHWHDDFVIMTNADGAEDNALVTAPVDLPERSNWRLWVPHQKGRYIRGVLPFSTFLVRSELRDARPHLVLMKRDGFEHDISFNHVAYSVDISKNQRYDNDFVSFTYCSPTVPPMLLKADTSSKNTSPLLSSHEALLFDSERYCLTRLDIPLPDDEPVPVTLLSLRDSPPNPNQPLYLYAYGAYGEVLEDKYRPDAIALVERGWTYAIAHVRGGGERGSHWWRTALKHGKKKTFSDYITCAEKLILDGYAGQGNIVAHGMSAGGLLMGAVFTERPDLWAGVIAQVPFVDVLNTLDDWQNHPLGSTPFSIWGDPRIEEDYRYIASYSPYEALAQNAYPALLTTGGVADDRVAFWEPLKFTAKARDVTTGGAPALCKIGLQTGHLGDVTPGGQLEQNTMFLTFAVRAVDGKWG